jgi:hypothetical protein
MPCGPFHARAAPLSQTRDGGDEGERVTKRWPLAETADVGCVLEASARMLKEGLLHALS